MGIISPTAYLPTILHSDHILQAKPLKETLNLHSLYLSIPKAILDAVSQNRLHL